MSKARDNASNTFRYAGGGNLSAVRASVTNNDYQVIAPFAIYQTNLTLAANGASSITFPTSRFTQTPMVHCSFNTASTAVSGPCSTAGPSTTGVTVYNSSNVTRAINVVAIQMLSTGAAG
jgi:hypothetical protein